MPYFQAIQRLIARFDGNFKQFLKALSRSHILYSSTMVGIMIVIGAICYSILEGWTLLDSFYATIVTVTTVGYGDLSPQTFGGRLFAIFFTMVAIGVAGYALSTVAAFVIDREQKRFKRIIQERKMKQIAELKDHVVLCGGGYVGKRIASEFYKNKTPFILVDPREDIIRWTLLYLHEDYVAKKIQQFKTLNFLEHDTSEYETQDISELAENVDVLYLQEDATQDRTLLRAGIERAKALVAALEEDRDNLFVVLSARQLARRLGNPDLQIITRVVDEENTNKLRAAGANQVHSPNVIGGFQMASGVLQPAVADFWEHMLYRNDELVRFIAVHIDEYPDLIGQTVGDLSQQKGIVTIAIKRQGKYEYTPEPQTILQKEDILIVVGKLGDSPILVRNS